MTLDEAVRLKELAMAIYGLASSEIATHAPWGQPRTEDVLRKYFCRFKKCDAAKMAFSRIEIIKHVRDSHGPIGLKEAVDLTAKWERRPRRKKAT